MNILLVEPNYKNKYPPMGLMKISTYHKNRGDNVLFFKGTMNSGDLKKYNFDRVYITSLFTFYYKETLQTIKYYEELINTGNIYIGGIMVTLMKNKIKSDVNKNVHMLTGLLTNSSVLNLFDNVNVDILPLDYSILDDVDYKYPAGDNYYGYISRGCSNKCSFCAVPLLEPKLSLSNNIVNQITEIKNKYGEKQNLLLLDNNILSFSVQKLKEVVKDICSLGFYKNAKYTEELPFKNYISKLSKYQLNSKAFQKVLYYTIAYLESKITLKKSPIYNERYNYILKLLGEEDNKYNVIESYKDNLIEILGHYSKSKGRKRYVDFNQGIDARLLTAEKMAILSKIEIDPFRLAFDDMQFSDTYIKAIKLANEYGVHSFSNYMLYNYNDKPEELWQRLKVNIDLAKELKIKIFSFPMKYAPIDKTDRKFVGKYWNKHYLNSIYAILNVCKGIVASGESFFYKAFGNTVDEYYDILAMPKEFILYRKYFEENGLTKKWEKQYKKLSEKEKSELLITLSNKQTTDNKKIISILKYYKIKR